MKQFTHKLTYAGWIITALASGTTFAATLHVWQDNPSPASPFDSWGNAATSIQDAVDAAQTGDLVLVTNGVYATGGRYLTRVAIDKTITVESVNGPEATVIEGAPTGGGSTGHGPICCVNLSTNAILSGFTLTNGYTDVDQDGAGAYCASSAIVTNCLITGNWAGFDGGGAYGGTLYDCILRDNSCYYESGGGACSCTLYNCTLSDNTAWSGGGAYFCTLHNCTLSGNKAWQGGGGGSAFSTLYNCIVYYNTEYYDTSENYSGCTLNYCCTTPLPTGGVGNIDLDPLFVDTNGWSNLRLQSNSPCINAGNNAYVTDPTDLDGNPRIVSGTVDVGAYEYQGPGSAISYAWLQHYDLPTDGSADTLDADLDGHNAWQEWKADTDPTSALSCFHIDVISKSSPAMVSFLSSSNRTYTLWHASQFGPPNWTEVPGQQAIPGTGGTLTLGDNEEMPQQFYRVEVHLP